MSAVGMLIGCFMEACSVFLRPLLLLYGIGSMAGTIAGSESSWCLFAMGEMSACRGSEPTALADSGSCPCDG